LAKDKIAMRVRTASAGSVKKLGIESSEFNWSKGKPGIKMIAGPAGLCVLTKIGGHFFGSGELVGIYVHRDGYWRLEGHAKQPLVAAATSLRCKTPPWSPRDLKLYAWRQGEKPVKIIHKDEGFCVLASVGGRFEGVGESVHVYLADDGFWYLGGESNQTDVKATAFSVRFKKKQAVKISTYTWNRGGDPVPLIKSDEGICFLSGVCGKFAGLGEEVHMHAGDDGTWYLSGQSGQESLRAEAVSIGFP
jgi:hypothetical protein